MLPNSHNEPTSPITLRPAENLDAEFFAGLYAAIRREEFAVLGWDEAQLTLFLKMQYDFQQSSYAMQFPEAKIFAIEVDRQTAGRMIIDDGPKEIRLVDIALVPEMQGCGIGKAVLWSLQTAAADKSLTLHVLKTNLPALTLYQKCGFKIIGNDDLSYEMEWRNEPKNLQNTAKNPISGKPEFG